MIKRPNFNYGRFRKQHQPSPPQGRGEEVLRLLKGTLTSRNKRMKVTLAVRRKNDADRI